MLCKISETNDVNTYPIKQKYNLLLIEPGKYKKMIFETVIEVQKIELK
jgi:hypothetical protein